MTDSNSPPSSAPPADGAAATTTTTMSGSSSSTPVASAVATPTPPPPESRPKDPRIAALHAMFPDYDDLILYSVLDSVGGDEARAIDALLGMSDPEYKPEPVPAAAGDPTAGAGAASELSQTELDEQLARHLMLEEQQEHQAAWEAQQAARRPSFARRAASGEQNQYQQQGQGQGSPQGQAGGSTTGETMAEIQQQLGKFAETGKKTLGTFFNKVKAKIQEMDQPRYVACAALMLMPSKPPDAILILSAFWDTRTTPSPTAASYDPAAYEQSVYAQQANAYVPYATRPPRGAQAQQPAFYDPNASSGPGAPHEAHGYDVDSGSAYTSATEHGMVCLAPRNTPPPLTSGAAATSAGNNTGATAAYNDIPAPRPLSSSGLTSPPIDGGKLGLLPKRPVALLRPGEQGAPQLERQHSLQSQDSDDDLEYAENPFEEKRT
ncbi:hypothetical protein H0H92_013762 [Tricholoma furcatifolium]|nr:hypothetical protein H0H92_013762 [Tricholoma furcatifolium]